MCFSFHFMKTNLWASSHCKQHILLSSWGWLFLSWRSRIYSSHRISKAAFFSLHMNLESFILTWASSCNNSIVNTCSWYMVWNPLYMRASVLQHSNSCSLGNNLICNWSNSFFVHFTLNSRCISFYITHFNVKLLPKPLIKVVIGFTNTLDMRR